MVLYRPSKTCCCARYLEMHTETSFQVKQTRIFFICYFSPPLGPETGRKKLHSHYKKTKQTLLATSGLLLVQSRSSDGTCASLLGSPSAGPEGVNQCSPTPACFQDAHCTRAGGVSVSFTVTSLHFDQGLPWSRYPMNTVERREGRQRRVQAGVCVFPEPCNQSLLGALAQWPERVKPVNSKFSVMFPVPTGPRQKSNRPSSPPGS